MAIAAAIGAAGIGSALIGANASSNASNAQVQMQEQALAQQKAMFGVAQNALNPFISSGQSVLPTLQGLLTPGTSAATLSQMPGFQFQSQYGTMAAQNALAGKTGPSAGPLAAAISQYNNGLAGTQYFNTVNALQGFANTGANAAGNLAGGAISSGNAQANTLGNVGNAQAQGILGSANALSGGLNSLGSAALFQQLYGGGGGNGLYTPQQIGNIGNMNAANVTDAQSNAYGAAMGLT